jgi:hypothetical protein
MGLFGWRARPTLPEIEARLPALRGRDEPALLAALTELRRLHDADNPRADLVDAEPRLRRLVLEAATPVRVAALDAWACVVERRVERHHLDLLFDLSSEPALPPALLDAVMRAALLFGDADGQLSQALRQNAALHYKTRKNQHLR